MSYKIHRGDVLSVLPTLQSGSVHCVFTSPPYWGGLRNYPIEPLVWPAVEYSPMPGVPPIRIPGDPECQHEWQNFERVTDKRVGLGLEALGEKYRGGGHKLQQLSPQWQNSVRRLRHSDKDFDPKTEARGNRYVTSSSTCTKCGAWRGNLGNEPNPEMFVGHLVLIFREVYRVLRDDGVLWLNLGDTSAAYWGDGSAIDEGRPSRSDRTDLDYIQNERPTFHDAFDGNGIKDKDLVGIPWRVAFALQADGWYLRQDIFWRKLTWTPDSVNGWRWEHHRVRKGDQVVQCEGCDRCRKTDGMILRKGAWRPTRAHEMIFELTKSTKYYCDREAVRQPPSESSLKRINQKSFSSQTGGDKDYGTAGVARNRSSRVALEGFARNPGHNLITDWDEHLFPDDDDLETVWIPKPTPTSEAHFAAFPYTLPMLGILAGTSEKGVCPQCGAPWARVVKGDIEPQPSAGTGSRPKYKEGDKNSPLRRLGENTHSARQAGGRDHDNPFPFYETVSWRPTCKCGCDEVIPATVLDIFLGSGSTLIASELAGRTGIGVEYSDEYCEIAERRIQNEGHPQEKKDKPRENVGHLSLFEEV